VQKRAAAALIANSKPVRRATLFCFRLATFAFALTTSWQTAFADAKIIHVPEALAAEDLPNPPANEDEAAAMHGELGQLPRVLRLEADMSAIPVPKPARTVPACSCPPAPGAPLGSSP
jgi:hypothetical protein